MKPDDDVLSVRAPVPEPSPEPSPDTSPAAESALDSISRKAGRGLRWSLVGIAVSKMASFLTGLALAHILTPSDFGVYAIAMAVSALLMHINDLGIIAAVVQWRGRMEEIAATAAVLAFVFSLACYAVIWAAAPGIADLASIPRATPVIRVMALIIVIDGVTAVRAAALLRRFEQDKLTKANLAGFAVQAPLSIVLALTGSGPYSFAVAQVVGNVLTGICVLAYAKVPAQFALEPTARRYLLAFGTPLALSFGIEALLLNGDYLIVGNLLGDTALGFYLLAFNISSWMPGIITTAVRYVSVAGFSRLAEHEEQQALNDGVHRSIPALLAIVVPISVVIAVLAPEMILVFYGERWLPSADVLRFLMVLVAARVTISFIFDILTSLGAIRSTLWLNLGWAVALAPALWFGTREGGIKGAAAAHALAALTVAVPLALLFLHRAGVELRPMLHPVTRIFAGAALGGVTCEAVRAALPDHHAAVAHLLVAGGSGFAVYLAVVFPDRIAAFARRGHAEVADSIIDVTAPPRPDRVTRQGLVTVAIPVRNGAETLAATVRSVLAQDYADLEVLIADNASTDDTGAIAQELAARDPRVRYHRHAENIGLLKNIEWVKDHARGHYLRCLGDDDTLAPTYVSRCLELFRGNPELVLVTTQIRYIDRRGDEALVSFDATRFASDDPVTRFGAMLGLVTRSPFLLDPLYGLSRTDVVRSLRHPPLVNGDEIYGAMLALAGPWGHVGEALAARRFESRSLAQIAAFLELPTWHVHAANAIQARSLLDVVATAPLTPAQRRSARVHIARLYGRRQMVIVARRVRKVIARVRSRLAAVHEVRG